MQETIGDRMVEAEEGLWKVMVQLWHLNSQV